jgi:hypothetical protein
MAKKKKVGNTNKEGTKKRKKNPSDKRIEKKKRGRPKGTTTKKEDEKIKSEVNVKKKRKYTISSRRKLYFTVQKELSKYAKEKEIKFKNIGEFTTYTKNIYWAIEKEYDFLKKKKNLNQFVRQNIEALFIKKSTHEKEVLKDVTRVERVGIIKSIYFWSVEIEFDKPLYDDIKIVFDSFDDGIIDIPMKEFKNGHQFSDWFARVIKPHCRNYYNKSPVAILSYISYNKEEGWAEYELLTGTSREEIEEEKRIIIEKGVGEIEEKKPEITIEKKKPTSPTPTTEADKRIREKELDIELERERQKTISQLREAGFTPEQILEFLRLTLK